MILYEIVPLFKKLLEPLKEAGIDTRGLFMNANYGFDGTSFRAFCEEEYIEANIKTNPRNGTTEDKYVYFDELLYKRRVKIEHTNAWMDGFKPLLIRFETAMCTWMSLQ
jgi:hypothetical protein